MIEIPGVFSPARTAQLVERPASFSRAKRLVREDAQRILGGVRT
jgi:hypothetical protein